MMNERIENEYEVYEYLRDLHDEDSDGENLSMYMSVKIIRGVFPDIGLYDSIRIVGRFFREREAAAASE